MSHIREISKSAIRASKWLSHAKKKNFEMSNAK